MNRTLHRWGAILIALPLLIIIGSGILLQLKKELAWVQPTTLRGAQPGVAVTWEQILAAACAVPDSGVRGWDDVERLDVQHKRGLIKVQCANRWELQLDSVTGALLSSAFRRSDLIESIHDGSFFHDKAKLWIWLPAGVVLLGLWGTGIYLWLLPHLARRRKRRAAAE
jgi:uncharacterized iron-regulated membrane protein